MYLPVCLCCIHAHAHAFAWLNVHCIGKYPSIRVLLKVPASLMHISQGMCLPCGVNTNQNSLLLYLQGIMSRCQGGSCMRPATLCALPWPPTTRGHTPIKWAGDLITPSCAFHPLVIHKAFLLLKRSCSACLRHQSATHCAEAAAAAAVCRAAWYANTRTTCPEYHIQYNLETPIHSNIEGRCAIFPGGKAGVTSN